MEAVKPSLHFVSTEIADPARRYDRSDIALPACKKSSTENRWPMRSARMDRELPREPNCSIEALEPSFTTFRMDREEPMLKWSSTEVRSASRTPPKTDSVLPNAVATRIEIALPSDMKSNTEMREL